MAKTLLQMEDVRDRSDIAAYLHRLAEKLEAGGELTLTAGDQTAELRVPNRAEFELKVEQARSFRGSKGETSIEIDLEWDEQKQETQRDLEID